MKDETREKLGVIIGGVIAIVIGVSVVVAFTGLEHDYEPLCLKKCNEHGMAYKSMHIVHVICGCGLYCDCEGESLPVCDEDISPTCMMYFLGAPLIAIGIALSVLHIRRRGNG